MVVWTPEKIANDTQQLLVDQLGVDADEVSPDSTVEDLGADSLDTIEIIMAAEEHFGIEISDEDGEKWRTVREMNHYLEKRLLR